MDGQVDLLILTYLKFTGCPYIGLDFFRTGKGLGVIMLNLIVEKGIIGSLDQTVDHPLGKVLDMGDKAVVADVIFIHIPSKMQADNIQNLGDNAGNGIGILPQLAIFLGIDKVEGNGGGFRLVQGLSQPLLD